MRVQVAAAREGIGRHSYVVDAAIALLVLGVSLQPLWAAGGCRCTPTPSWGYALVVAQCVPLVWRRRWPFAMSLGTGLLAMAYGISSLPDPAVPFAALVALYTVAAHASRGRARAAGVIAAIGITVALLIDASHIDSQDVTVNALIFATAWLLGDGARSRRERAVELERRAAALERTRAAEAGRAVAMERNRIAREMHDIVAHHVSMIVVQAEAGPVVVHRDADLAVAAFDSISAAGKQVLTEMRRVLGMLRSEAADDRLAPQPGVAALDGLIAGVRSAGLDVDLRTRGAPRTLPPAIDLSAYRVVQEALTNVVKHGGSATAVVVLEYDDDALRIEVADNGRSTAVGGPGGGAGLVGMAERAALVGGTMTAGPLLEGGWLVEVMLPLAGVPVG